MELKEIARVLSRYLLAFAVVLLIPLGVSYYYDTLGANPRWTTAPAAGAFLKTIGVTLITAALLALFGRKASGRLYRREGLLLVALIWLLTPALGSLPFLFNKTLDRFSEAYFEATSGFTTAGITILSPKLYDESGQEVAHVATVCGDPAIRYSYFGNVRPARDVETGQVVALGIEAVNKGLLFWRSFMQWVGGIGVIVLFISILPALGMGAKVLLQAEMTGPMKEGLTPRIRQTASLFCSLYLGLTLAQVLLLLWTNPRLPFFDAVTLSLSTLSTGGFSVRNDNLAAYGSRATEWVVFAFMLLGSVNFALYYYALRRQFRRLADPELFTYICLLLFFSALIVWNLAGKTIGLLDGNKEWLSAFDAVRLGLFQLVSAITSTGFILANYDTWPFLSQTLLLLAMFLGGMSGSTAGGLKAIRVYLLGGLLKNRLETVYQPEAVRFFHVGKMAVSGTVAATVLNYFLLFVLTTVVGSLVFLLQGLDPSTSLSLTACMVGNVGLAFGGAGPTETAALLSPWGQFFSCFLMILGRLEFFVLIILFIPEFWRRK